MTAPPLLTIECLSVRYGRNRRLVHAVTDVSLSLAAGEALGIVGESGCGKSTLALAAMGLLDRRVTRVDGSIRLGDRELTALSPSLWQDIRGRRIAMIFQDPMTSLNPYLRIGLQLTEQIRRHLALDATAARRHAIAMLAQVGIPDAERCLSSYPHEFSGGMRQRVMIAMALSCEPELLIADEPTTALDVTIQAQILALIRQQMERRRMGLLLITHDLGVVAGICEKVAVMYAGQIVEEAPAESLYARPCHPYTRALLRAVSRVDRPVGTLASIPGIPPALGAPPTSCTFAPRCPFAEDLCRQGPPPLREDSRQRRHRCCKELAFSGEVL